MKNKKNAGLEVVDYYIKHNGEHAWPEAVYKNVKTTEQMMFSIKGSFICFPLFLILAVVFNAHEGIPYHEKIGQVCLVVSLAGSVFLSLRALLKFLRVLEFCGFNRGNYDSILDSVLKERREFKRLFGRRPEKIGAVKAAKILTRKARQVLDLKAKDDSGREHHQRWLLKQMFNSAQNFWPIPSYPGLYHAAKTGEEVPAIPGIR